MRKQSLTAELHISRDAWDVELEIDFTVEKGLPGDRMNPPEPNTYEIEGVFIMDLGKRIREEKLGKHTFVDQYDEEIKDAMEAAVTAHFAD